MDFTTEKASYSVSRFEKFSAVAVCFAYFLILVYAANSHSSVFALTKTMLNLAPAGK